MDPYYVIPGGGEKEEVGTRWSKRSHLGRVLALTFPVQLFLCYLTNKVQAALQQYTVPTVMNLKLWAETQPPSLFSVCHAFHEGNNNANTHTPVPTEH